MSRTTLIVTVIAAALAATASPARTADISAGAGCSIQCIEAALVTPTASGGTLRVRTSVPASVIVSVVKVGAVQLAAPGVSAHTSVPAFLTDRTIVLTGLQPETSYRIVVKATDLAGKTSSRAGTFTTRAVQVANPVGIGDLASNAGCSARCIQRALVEQSQAKPDSAVVDIRTSTPASLRLRVMRGALLVDEVSSSGRKTSWQPTIDGLEPGTRYAVSLRATDANGLVEERSGTFETADATVRVTIAKIRVIDDSEKDSNRGEIRFDYRVNGVGVDGGGRRTLGSGSTIGAPVAGTSRPGATFAFPVDAATILELRVRADECDSVMRKNCEIEESGGPSFSGGSNAKKLQWAVAVGTFDPGKLLVGAGSSPGWRGVSEPAGHDALFSFETTSHRLKFRVLATVDVEHHFEG